MSGLDILLELVLAAFILSALAMCSGCSTLTQLNDAISASDVDLANQIWYTHQLTK